jgi:hypothetical protein
VLHLAVTSIVKLVEVSNVRGRKPISSTPSKTIDPPLAELKVGPLTNVPLLPPLEISFQEVEPETYE